MHEINFIDRSFKQESAGIYSVSIQANSSGLAYSICDNVANSIILFRKHRFNQVILQSDLIRSISDVMNSDETLSLDFSRVRFLGYTRQTTLIPAEYYDPESNRKYLTFSEGETTEDSVFSNFIEPPGIYNIFSLPGELVSLITLFYKKVEFINQTTTFLRNISKQPDAFRNKVVYMGLNPEFFDIACTGDGKLLLYNTFQYTSETDLLYYVFFVYNQMHFEPDKIPLVLSGELSSKLSYLDILKQYFAGTRCDEATGTPVLASGIRQLSTARFLNLLNLHVCESSAEYTEEGRSK